MSNTLSSEKVATAVAKKTPAPQMRSRTAGTMIKDAPIPVTVLGQKYVAPAHRHSKQSHARAQARGEAQGHSTERDLQLHDRSVVAEGIAEVARVKKVHEQARAK